MTPGPTLLFVDDDRRQRGPYVEALRDSGFAVTEVSTVDDALREINTTRYDVTVLDLLMDPGSTLTDLETAGGTTTGWQLARRVRRAAPQALVIILSAARNHEVEDWCSRQRPPVLFVTKASVLYDEFVGIIMDNLETNRDPAIGEVQLLLKRFHTVATQLARRHDHRQGHSIEDEYDVQDLLHGLLKSRFDDVRSEEWTPSYAGGSSRIDFLIRESSVAVEVKKTRTSLSIAKLGEQLIVDITRYRVHPTCRILVCFVYDPGHLVDNPPGLKSDLEQLSSPDLLVLVEIAP